MRSYLLIASFGLTLLFCDMTTAQPPESRDRAEKKTTQSAGVDKFVNRMLKLDADYDGKLSRAEVDDPRLQAMFERADADKDGIVTKVELQELFKKESPIGGMNSRNAMRPGRGNRPPQDGPGPTRGGRQQFGPPRPGQILTGPLQDALELTDEQRKQIDSLQKDVDERLDRILTDKQKQQLRQARNRESGSRPRGNDEPPGIPFDPVEIPAER